MGPNLKFVLAITDAFSNKKNGGQFFSRKKDQTPGGGGGPGGVWKKTILLPHFFSAPFPKQQEQNVASNKMYSHMKPRPD